MLDRWADGRRQRLQLHRRQVGRRPVADEGAGYPHDHSCSAPNGLSIRSNNVPGDRFASWGVAAAWEFTPPPDTRITGMKPWRYSKVARTDTGGREGRWELLAPTTGGSQIGGPRGPDRCKPGAFGFTNPCSRGARGFGADAVSTSALVAPKLSFGLFCATDAGTLQACHTAGSDGRQRQVQTSAIHASPRTLPGGGRVRVSGRLGLRGATVPRSGKLVDLQAFDRGRWRTFATARARGSKGAWCSTYRFAGNPGRYRVRLRIRREDVFPCDVGYARWVVVRVR